MLVSFPKRNQTFKFLSGQYLAAQMQAANPDLVEQFRQNTFRNPSNRDGDDKGISKVLLSLPYNAPTFCYCNLKQTPSKAASGRLLHFMDLMC
ncbi:hypothetical protein CEXT_491111 [Caerostris extrusa]|uniref:Uncharacterized protein n=1 Tax=Caerostris extrusa TaxID=172846 RepID=A0AAV4UG15_CAEEX|nr:hypothetical protein CEXT_491111 [Caerostris extrusa]